jgi:excisionase family DNA binding protein
VSVEIVIRLNGAEVPVEFDEEALAMIAAALPKPEPMPPSPFLTIREAAELLRCPRQRVDDLLSARRLERVKDGARTLIRRSDLDAYLLNGGNRRRHP